MTVNDQEKDQGCKEDEPADHPYCGAKIGFVARGLASPLRGKRLSWCFHSLYMTGKGSKGNTARLEILDSFVRKKALKVAIISFTLDADI